jgi:hypothetical protein
MKAFRRLDALDGWVRGWLPKDPIAPASHGNKQTPLRYFLSTVAAIIVGLAGGLGLAFGGILVAIGFERVVGLYLVSLGMPMVLLAVPVFLIPAALNVGLGYALRAERPTIAKVLLYGGPILSIGVVFFLATLG